MRTRKLKINFYARPTLAVAKDLLGKYIVRKIGNKKLIAKIIETEAYIGPKDRASHAFGNKITKRNKAEYLIGGHIYIYLVYGMYWQFNISTSLAGKPECVLIRAIDPHGIHSKFNIPHSKFLSETNGPGKLCNYLKLNKSFYGKDLTKSKRIWLSSFVPTRSELRKDREKFKIPHIVATKRIGIDYAGPYWASKKWRFLIKDYVRFLTKSK